MQKYKQKLSKILKTQLSVRNITKAINAYAISILITTYSFGIIKWTDTDLEKLNTTTSNKYSSYTFINKNSHLTAN